jgi:hypothetical protein
MVALKPFLKSEAVRLPEEISPLKNSISEWKIFPITTARVFVDGLAVSDAIELAEAPLRRQRANFVYRQNDNFSIGNNFSNLGFN